MAGPNHPPRPGLMSARREAVGVAACYWSNGRSAVGAFVSAAPQERATSPCWLPTALKSVSFLESRRSCRGDEAPTQYARRVTGSLVRIIMPPLFRQSPAPVPCDKRSLRWPGPFGSGFLSPQPPGIVGIGPIAGRLTGPTRVGPFLFFKDRLPRDEATRRASPQRRPHHGTAPQSRPAIQKNSDQ
jgi:hypothetical protein